jgi:hypothetical protein
MPRPRNPENEGLPNRWQRMHGAYYYQVPPGTEPWWDHKKKFRLGATFEEALEAFAYMVTRTEASEGIPNSKLLAAPDILSMSAAMPRSGVYFLINEGKIVYVGRSANISERIATHVKNNEIPFGSTHMIPAAGVEMDRLEQIYIGSLKPEFNIYRGGKKELNSAT